MPSRRNTTRISGLLLAALAPLFCAGCPHKTVHAVAPVATPPSGARPMTIAPDTDASPPLETESTAPELPAPAAASSPVDIAPSRVAPPPRRPPAAAPPSDESGAGQDASSHPQPPRIVPQLSAGDQAADQRRTEDDTGVANKNLQSIGGRQLNATQQDLADKIRTFLAQSTEAGKGGDWTRAQNLAQKARVLSVELINSL